MSLSDPPAKRRWPRSQRFIVSSSGASAEAQYRETITASRAQGGRESFDAAREKWASCFAVEPDDGMYLGELLGAAKTLEQVASAVESAGLTRTQAMDALGRLLDAGLIQTQALPATPAPNGWPR